MQVIVQSLSEAREVCHTSMYFLRYESRQRGHDEDSCGCDVCKSYRLLKDAIQRLAAEIASQS